MTPDPEMAAVQDAGESYHPPIHEGIGPHRFVDSEFEHGKGRCDRCGGGPLAEIHQQRVDPLELIAGRMEPLIALDRIHERLQDLLVPTERAVVALEGLTGELGRMASDASARNNHQIIAIWAAVAVISWVMGIVVGHAWK